MNKAIIALVVVTAALIGKVASARCTAEDQDNCPGNGGGGSTPAQTPEQSVQEYAAVRGFVVDRPVCAPSAFPDWECQTHVVLPIQSIGTLVCVTTQVCEDSCTYQTSCYLVP